MHERASPAERLDAKSRSLSSGNRRSSRISRLSRPTTPVAPITATVYLAFLATPVLMSPFLTRHALFGAAGRKREAVRHAIEFRSVLGLRRPHRHLIDRIGLEHPLRRKPQRGRVHPRVGPVDLDRLALLVDRAALVHRHAVLRGGIHGGA